MKNERKMFKDIERFFVLEKKVISSAKAIEDFLKIRIYNCKNFKESLDVINLCPQVLDEYITKKEIEEYQELLYTLSRTIKPVLN